MARANGLSPDAAGPWPGSCHLGFLLLNVVKQGPQLASCCSLLAFGLQLRVRGLGETLALSLSLSPARQGGRASVEMTQTTDCSLSLAQHASWPGCPPPQRRDLWNPEQSEQCTGRVHTHTHQPGLARLSPLVRGCLALPALHAKGAPIDSRRWKLVLGGGCSPARGALCVHLLCFPAASLMPGAL